MTLAISRSVVAESGRPAAVSCAGPHRASRKTRRMFRSASIAALALASAALPASAQNLGVGGNLEQGLPLSVAAPQGASWTLECRFRPVTVTGRTLNSISFQGSGPRRERLPGDNGRCTLTKTGGNGPIGLAVVKNGTATAAGTNDPATPASVQVF